MSNDLISRKSVLDYIENEISTARSTETISYLRALSVHINEYEPTAFDLDRVVQELEDVKELNEPRINNKTLERDIKIYKLTMNFAIKIVKAGGV